LTVIVPPCPGARSPKAQTYWLPSTGVIGEPAETWLTVTNSEGRMSVSTAPQATPGPWLAKVRV